MSRYIDVDKLGIGRADPKIFNNPEYANGWNSAIEIIEKAPTADVVEVVRCKDCRHYEYFTVYNKHFCNEYGGYVVENDFCSRAEKKVSKNDK